MNINDDIKYVFTEHGFKVQEENDVLKVKLKDEIFIDSNVTQREEDQTVTSRLDVKFSLDNGQQIIECFGDIGSNKEIAKGKNIQNFSLNAFHPITSCLMQNSQDQNITFEEWDFNGSSWEVYVGNFGIKELSDRLEGIPENLFSTIEHLIKEIDLNSKYAWVRFYMCQAKSEIIEMELLVNNIKYPEGEEILKKLEWEKIDSFYSVRNFLMMRKKEKEKKNWFHRLFRI